MQQEMKLTEFKIKIIIIQDQKLKFFAKQDSII